MASKRLTKNLGRTAPAVSSKAEPNCLKSSLKPGETREGREAEFMIEGLAMNAVVGLAFSTRLGTLDLTECFAQILCRAREVANRNTESQEQILAGQIISLNAVYTDLAIIARSNMSNCVVFERLMRLALKAQSNCRATAEALAAIQNPPTVFARQANIANGPQQINNGSSSSRARESILEPNELLEAHGERLDPRTQSTTSNRDRELATVGTIDRSQDRQREGTRIAQRMEGRIASSMASIAKGAQRRTTHS